MWPALPFYFFFLPFLADRGLHYFFDVMSPTAVHNYVSYVLFWEAILS